MLSIDVTFDGHRLNDVCNVSNVKHPVVSRQNTSKVVPGRDGSVLTSSSLSNSSASMKLSFIGGTESERLEAMATVESWLNVSEPRPLSFSNDGGLYYMAVPANKGERRDSVNGTKISNVSFLITDPVRYGESKSIASSSSSTTIQVGGNYRTAVDIASQDAARDATTGLWGLRIDNGDYIRVALDSGSHAVLMRSTDYYCTVDGSLKLPTTDSDWVVLEPGEHTISRELGTGSFTLDWVERWL